MANLQNTPINLAQTPWVSSVSSTTSNRRSDDSDMSILTQVLVVVIILVIVSIAGSLTAVFLTMNTSTNSETTSTSSTTTTSTTAATMAAPTVFALSQVINGQTVTCSSVVNTNPSYTECDNLQEGGLYAANGVTCTAAWSTTPSPYWATVAFCQAFLNSNNTYIQAYYNCSATQTRFTWSNGVWGTTSDNGYTQNLQCYY